MVLCPHPVSRKKGRDESLAVPSAGCQEDVAMTWKSMRIRHFLLDSRGDTRIMRAISSPVFSRHHQARAERRARPGRGR